MTFAELKNCIDKLPADVLERDVTVRMGEGYYPVFNFQIYMADGKNITGHSPFLFIQR